MVLAHLRGCFPSSRKKETFTMHLRTRSGTSSKLAFWNMHLGGFLCEKIPLIRHHARMSQKLRKSGKILSNNSLHCLRLHWKLLEHLRDYKLLKKDTVGLSVFDVSERVSCSFRLLLKFGICLLKMDRFTMIYRYPLVVTWKRCTDYFSFGEIEAINLAGY